MSISTPMQTDSVLRQELAKLDEEMVLLGGQFTKPSSCYRLSGNPPYVLYNTNCPESLMEKIEAILSKYRQPHEARP